MTDDPTGEYKESLTVSASVDQVFDFISDIGNLPKYLPTTKGAQSQGENRVRVQGEADGHRYDSDGYLRCDRDARRMEWGADEGYYSGWMQLEERSEQTEVTVSISLRGKPPGAPEGSGPTPDEVREGLRASLASIQNQVEGDGGKVEPAAAT